MLHLHSAVRGTVPQKQRCDTADLNANWYHVPTGKTMNMNNTTNAGKSAKNQKESRMDRRRVTLSASSAFRGGGAMLRVLCFNCFVACFYSSFAENMPPDSERLWHFSTRCRQ
jgi:hypothetical protein